MLVQISGLVALQNSARFHDDGRHVEGGERCRAQLVHRAHLHERDTRARVEIRHPRRAEGQDLERQILTQHRGERTISI